MRVICINNKPIPGSRNLYLDLLKEGEIYTVTDYIDGSRTLSGYSGYKLKEVRLGEYEFFTTNRFIPLTGEDTEVILEEEVLCESELQEG